MTEVLLLEAGHRRHEGPGGKDIHVLPLQEPFPVIGPDHHLRIRGIRSGYDLPTVAFDETNQILVQHLVVSGVEIPKDGHLRPPDPVADNVDGFESSHQSINRLVLGTIPLKCLLQCHHTHLEYPIGLPGHPFIGTNLASHSLNESPEHVPEVGVQG